MLAQGEPKPANICERLAVSQGSAPYAIQQAVTTAITTGSTRGRTCLNTASMVRAAISMNGVSWWLEAIATISGSRQATRTSRVAPDTCGLVPGGRVPGPDRGGGCTTIGGTVAERRAA